LTSERIKPEILRRSILLSRPDLGGVQGAQPGRTSKCYGPQTKKLSLIPTPHLNKKKMFYPFLSLINV